MPDNDYISTGEYTNFYPATITLTRDSADSLFIQTNASSIEQQVKNETRCEEIQQKIKDEVKKSLSMHIKARLEDEMDTLLKTMLHFQGQKNKLEKDIGHLKQEVRDMNDLLQRYSDSILRYDILDVKAPEEPQKPSENPYN